MTTFKYDKEARALYIKISDVPSSFGIVDHTSELVPDEVMIDYMKSGEIYGIEILSIDEVNYVRNR